ncbi:MAG: 2,3-bisphosphoglycerate-independent phosphoglycerate mutase [Thaumarchaeota archaeon]|nr:2,3-bisphosphoglycerate-independent phosphoglycerate mutase [Nitrososphaerota archaeon]
MNNSDVHMVYVLLDGIGDLPHPDLKGFTPLNYAKTPNLDRLARNGTIGEVISVGKGIAPQSDIAVFNMLGYRFENAQYVGRGVIEAIGVGVDFKNGDLALRGNFATVNDDRVITDRRAGRKIEKEDALAIAQEIEQKLKFSDPKASVVVAPTIGHRVIVRIRCDGIILTPDISNTDPAYARIDGMGVAKAVGDFMTIEKSLPLNESDGARLSASLVNEFTDKSLQIMKESPTNQNRKNHGKKMLNSILLRDAGNKFPDVVPINTLHQMQFSCIVDMPVEIGIANVLKMKSFSAGGLTDYEEKARVAAKAMETQNAIYVHIKGPDEFGHDGDAVGKMQNIEEIDKRFFGTLLDNIDTSKVAVVVSGDHSTPCINKSHSDDPVPVLVSGDMVKKDGTTRFTEEQAKKGKMGLLMGADVIKSSVKIIKS